jgi:hypothetical protein
MPKQQQERSFNNARINRKRKVLLDEEAERIIKEEERREFRHFVEDQIKAVDLSAIDVLPEFTSNEEYCLEKDGSWQYWMSVMLQYQTCKSYSHYADDEQVQLQQIQWQKEKRFQLMQKKRAIKREKRRLFKLKSDWEKSTPFVSCDGTISTSMITLEPLLLKNDLVEEIESEDDSIDTNDVPANLPWEMFFSQISSLPQVL